MDRISYGIFLERGPWAESAESALGYPTRVRVYDLKPKQNVKWTYVGLLDASIKSPVDPILLEEGKFHSHPNVLRDISPIAVFEILN